MTFLTGLVCLLALSCARLWGTLAGFVAEQPLAKAPPPPGPRGVTEWKRLDDVLGAGGLRGSPVPPREFERANTGSFLGE